MPFRMVCPKCDTEAFQIERERRYYSKADPVASLIMSCRCGLRMYGKAVEDEYRRQRKEYESTNTERFHEEADREHLAQVERKRRQQMRAALAYRAEVEANRKDRPDDGSASPAAAVKPAAIKTSTKPAAKAAAPTSPHPAILPSTVKSADDTAPTAASDAEMCSWHNCTRGPNGGRAVARKNSKYCSRACSNANARWRFKQRKKNADE